MKNVGMILVLALATASSAFADCQVSNLLDRDSYDVAAAGVSACLSSGKDCEIRSNRRQVSLTVANQDEGVGTVTYVLTATEDGTETLIGFQVNGPAHVIQAQGIPAGVSIEAVLGNFYNPTEQLPWGCQWK